MRPCHSFLRRIILFRRCMTMPRLKKLTKELRQKIIGYLFPFPPISKDLAFRLATVTFTKTRFCSHINFIGHCLNSKVIPKGFHSNFHASSFTNQYHNQIQCAQNSFSRNIMRITIRAMCQNVITSQNKFCIAALNFPKPVQQF